MPHDAEMGGERKEISRRMRGEICTPLVDLFMEIKDRNKLRLYCRELSPLSPRSHRTRALASMATQSKYKNTTKPLQRGRDIATLPSSSFELTCMLVLRIYRLSPNSRQSDQNGFPPCRRSQRPSVVNMDVSEGNCGPHLV